MFTPNKTRLSILALSLLLTSSASAGMTVITLNDIAEARLQSISFFIFLYLLLALAVKGLWNYLAKSFDWMPKINFRRALCLMLVSGLFLYVILTMISGARELLTPGAWDKQGIGYKLNSDQHYAQRKDKITTLKNKLWAYAENNGGKFPEGLAKIGEDSFRFQYFSGRNLTGKRLVLAYELAETKGKRLVLFSDGSVEEISARGVNTIIRDEKIK